MALQVNYNGNQNCYLKAVPTTISEFYVDEVKTFSTYAIYSISFEGEVIFRDGFEMNINPGESLFVQIYDRMKELFSKSTDI